MTGIWVNRKYLCLYVLTCVLCGFYLDHFVQQCEPKSDRGEHSLGQRCHSGLERVCDGKQMASENVDTDDDKKKRLQG